MVRRAPAAARRWWTLPFGWRSLSRIPRAGPRTLLPHRQEARCAACPGRPPTRSASTSVSSRGQRGGWNLVRLERPGSRPQRGIRRAGRRARVRLLEQRGRLRRRGPVWRDYRRSTRAAPCHGGGWPSLCRGNRLGGGSRERAGPPSRRRSNLRSRQRPHLPQRGLLGNHSGPEVVGGGRRGGVVRRRSDSDRTSRQPGGRSLGVADDARRRRNHGRGRHRLGEPRAARPARAVSGSRWGGGGADG